MKSCLALLIAIAGTSITSIAQTNPAASPALALLQQVSQKYATAELYHIEAVEETTRTGRMERYQSTAVYNAAEGPANRYRFAVQSAVGTMLVVSDGKRQWAYQPEAQRYTQAAAAADGYHTPEHMTPIESELYPATDMRKQLARLAKSYKSATQSADETITIGHRQIECAVIHVSTADAKRSPSGESFRKTFWIDKASDTLVKQSNRERIFNTPTPGVRIPEDVETVITYAVTQLDSPEIDAQLFTFTPPEDAKLVDHFPDPTTSDVSQWIGKAAPAMTLARADGTQVSLASFRGKPVLIDFWATWCAPCVASMPEMAELYQKTQSLGLVILGVDQDEEAKDATDFLARKNYTWPNFHDDGKAMSVFAERGIPRTVLIDSSGKVVYDESGVDHRKLLSAIAGLGPEYVSLAPKAHDPCAVAVK